ncbi:hypothetical protein HYD88_02760 [Mycoplasmopsis bovis]|nr:hypothetical protein [Mycoplasmopsis bovis]QQH36443.1 hypothetical protein HYD88_02760 [Mycoplasmopsis bovis]
MVIESLYQTLEKTGEHIKNKPETEKEFKGEYKLWGTQTIIREELFSRSRKGKVKGSKDLPTYTDYIPKSQFITDHTKEKRTTILRTWKSASTGKLVRKGFRTKAIQSFRTEKKKYFCH